MKHKKPKWLTLISKIEKYFSELLEKVNLYFLYHAKAQANLTDRSKQLKKVKIPALVMHREEDFLVDKYGGIQTAECIPNSKLVLIQQMGHLPFNREISEQFESEIIKFLTNCKG